MYMVTTSLMKIMNFFEILKFFEIFEILKFCENFEFLWKLKFLKISEFSLMDDAVRVFRKNKTFIQSGLGNKNPRKRFTLPVHSLKNYGPSMENIHPNLLNRCRPSTNGG